MSFTLILSVGSDAASLESRCRVLQSVGYTVVSAYSVTGAIPQFQDGDFDLVILDRNLSKEDKGRVAHSIREFGSRLPIISIGAGFEEDAGSPNLTVRDREASILNGISKSLSNYPGAAPMPVSRFGYGAQRRI